MKSMVMAALRGYKQWVSPMMPNACRFVPTCSEYTMEAVARYGVLRGLAMGGWRIVRCNPLGSHGYDPVPQAERQTNICRQHADLEAGSHLRDLAPRRCCPTSM